jgi:hypothetical protein
MAIAFLAGLAAAAELWATRNYGADHPGAGEVWSTKKVMDKVHVGKQSLFAVVNKEIHRAEPDWKTGAKNLAEIIRLMNMLTKQKPLRGSQEAWDKLVEDYVHKAKVARQNVKEHKLLAAQAALAKLRSTCEKCHDNHGIN